MLLTQVLSYGQVYDRAQLSERKDIADVHFCACMNPKAGSFMVNGRLQRHFTVLTVFSPSPATIAGIYTQILSRHLVTFSAMIQRLVEPLVGAMGDILTIIQSSPSFLPSAAKFHYQFNLKDVANVFQGLLDTSGPMFRDGTVKYLRVWLHECYRVFSDRLILASDSGELQQILEKVASKWLLGTPREELFAEPLIVTAFVSESTTGAESERHYLPVRDLQSLRLCLEGKLAEYNGEHAAMSLVLFDDALRHVCRISRITDNSCGSALLVGIGGSGKQSLARLASFINHQEVVSILVNQQYGAPELRADLQEFYKRAAVKPGTPHAFLMTDGQIVDERFLVYINDMLSSGNIPELFAREEYDNMFSSLRNVAKHAGYADDRESLFQFFLDKAAPATPALSLPSRPSGAIVEARRPPPLVPPPVVVFADLPVCAPVRCPRVCQLLLLPVTCTWRRLPSRLMRGLPRTRFCRGCCVGAEHPSHAI